MKKFAQIILLECRRESAQVNEQPNTKTKMPTRTTSKISERLSLCVALDMHTLQDALRDGWHQWANSSMCPYL